MSMAWCGTGALAGPDRRGRRSHTSYFLAATLALFASAPAIAEFRVVPSETKFTAATYEVDFAARVAPAGARSESVPVPPEWGIDGDAIALEGGAPNIGAESFLLAVESLDQARSATLACEPPSALAGVTTRGVLMGTIPALQVVVDPAKAGTGRVRLAIDLPANAPSKAVAASADPAELAQWRHFFLDGDALVAVPRASATASAKGAAPPAPAGDLRVDFRGEGLVGVSLASLGIEEAEVANLAFVQHGDRLPVGGVAGGNVWFFAAARETRYSALDAAFVDIGAATPSSAMATRPAFATLSPAGAEVAVARSRRYERNLHYQQIIVVQEADHFAFHRVGAPSSSSTPASATHQLPFSDVLASSNVAVLARIAAQNQTTTFAPDHYTDLTIGGVALPQVSWDGKIVLDHAANVDFQGAQLAPQFSFAHAVPQGLANPVVAAGGADQQRFDWLQLDYTGFPRAEGGISAIVDLPASAAPRRASVGGFPAGTTAADVAVLDITDPIAPVRLTGISTFVDSSGTVAVEFEAPATVARFLAQRIAAASGEAVGVAQPMPPLPSDRLRGIYVRPPQYAADLAPLVALRGPGIVEFSPQSAYDVFGGGRKDPQAIRDAVAWYLANAADREVQPDLLLVGHGTLDPRGDLGLAVAPEVPSFIEQSVQTSPGWLENPVDYLFACVEGEDEIPDVRLGRIPATTAAELKIAVDRIVAHDGLASTLQAAPRTGVFLAGSDNTGNRFTFINDQPDWTDLWDATGSAHVRIDDGTTTPDGQAEFNALRAAMEAGPGGAAYVQYMGHGFINNWQNNQMMNTGRVDDIDTANRWPLVATFTCFNGLYALPGSTNRAMVEAWLFFDANRGAVGAIAPVSVDFYFEQGTYARTFLEAIAQPAGARPRTLGAWVAATQTEFAVAYPGFFRTLHEFSYFGDPASPIALEPAPAGDRWVVR